MRWYSLGVEFSDNGKSNDTQRHNGDVVAGAHQSREQHGVGCWPEHVTMNLLPAILVTKVLLLRAHDTNIQNAEIFFTFYNCMVSMGFLLWEIQVAFPRESWL